MYQSQYPAQRLCALHLAVHRTCPFRLSVSWIVSGTSRATVVKIMQRVRLSRVSKLVGLSLSLANGVKGQILAPSQSEPKQQNFR